MENNKIRNSTILITGGAGFIGSYLAEELLKYSPGKIIILDNLIRGSFENMKEFINNPAVEFIEGDIKKERRQINQTMKEFDNSINLIL